MKPFILVAAVVAFELSFLASVATPPTPEPESVSVVQPRASATGAWPRGPGRRPRSRRAGSAAAAASNRLRR